MSAVPPDIVGSSAQAGYQQAEVAKIRDGERAGQANAATRRARAIDDAGNTIETGDSDIEVHADAEGSGGQGRATEEEANETDASETSERRDGIHRDDDGELHVDIQA
ncbi:MAG: hypothetical protein IID39_00490 [Planctomycetes bacterium]|nr:hypothetical protein [Planctomycetota bacterium]